MLAGGDDICVVFQKLLVLRRCDPLVGTVHNISSNIKLDIRHTSFNCFLKPPYNPRASFKMANESQKKHVFTFTCVSISHIVFRVYVVICRPFSKILWITWHVFMFLYTCCIHSRIYIIDIYYGAYLVHKMPIPPLHTGS